MDAIPFSIPIPSTLFPEPPTNFPTPGFNANFHSRCPQIDSNWTSYRILTVCGKREVQRVSGRDEGCAGESGLYHPLALWNQGCGKSHLLAALVWLAKTKKGLSTFQVPNH